MACCNCKYTYIIRNNMKQVMKNNNTQGQHYVLYHGCIRSVWLQLTLYIFIYFPLYTILHLSCTVYHFDLHSSNRWPFWCLDRKAVFFLSLGNQRLWWPYSTPIFAHLNTFSTNEYLIKRLAEICKDAASFANNFHYRPAKTKSEIGGFLERSEWIKLKG